MARVLALSSQVCFGHIGLGATVPMLQRAGHEVIAVPTIVLSNDPNMEHVGRHEISGRMCRDVIEALHQNGLLARVEGLLIGYLPTVEHVQCAVSAIAAVREVAPNAKTVCDPIVGDDPVGLYVDERVAVEIRNELCGRADVLTPNRFELSWLSQRDVNNVEDAVMAARSLGAAGVLVTSVPGGENSLENLWVTQNDSFSMPLKRFKDVPHGAGDAFAASFLGHTLNGLTPEDALADSSKEISAIVEASIGRDGLDLMVR